MSDFRAPESSVSSSAGAALGGAVEQPEAAIVAEALETASGDDASIRNRDSHDTAAPSERPRRDKSNRRRKAAHLAPARRCAELTKAGALCPATPLVKPDPDGTTRCAQHSRDPEVIAKREAARSRAGLATALRRLPPDIVVNLDTRDGVRVLLKSTAENVVADRLSPGQSNAINAICGTALKLAELELAVRIAELEERLAAQPRGPRIVVTSERKEG